MTGQIGVVFVQVALFGDAPEAARRFGLINVLADRPQAVRIDSTAGTVEDTDAVLVAAVQTV